MLVIAAVAASLALVQIGSLAFYTGRFPHALGVSIYGVLDRVAPAGFVEDTLGNDALAHRDFDAAEHYAVRMPASARRDELLGKIALARREPALAFEYFFASDDVNALQRYVSQLARHDVAGAIALEARIREHNVALGTHPDTVAESYWISGNYEVRAGDRRAALDDYRHAETLAPLDVKYILAAGNDALALGDIATALATFVHGVAVAPGSGNVLGGLGLAQLRGGDRAAATATLQRAQSVDASAPEAAALERALQ